MKHFTKEFNTLEWLSYANQHVKKSKNAERKDENFYQRVYEKQYAIYANFEKSCSWFQDPIEELCKQKFAVRNNALIAIYSRLPKEILDKIADIRVFALGYASAEVKRLLRPYCAELRRTVRQIREKAYDETDEAESHLTNILGFNEYEDCLIMGIEEKDGDIYLKGEDNDYLLIKEGEIIEGKGKTIYPYHENIPNSPWSRIIAAELHRTGDKFEVHFLVLNSDEIEKEDLWYLTLRGTDILRK